MAEVGVLELQIRDNSEEAAQGLSNLASSLRSVQRVFKKGLELGNVAQKLAELTQALQTAIPNESIARLERLAKAIETLNKAGGVRNAAKEAARVQDAMPTSAVQASAESSTMEQATEATKASVQATNSALEESVARIREQMAAEAEANNSMQATKASVEEASNAVRDMSTALDPVEQKIQETAENARRMAEELQHADLAARATANRSADEARLESQYENYRALFLEGGPTWEQQVPEMYGFTPEALRDGETYAEALEITMREVNRYVDEFIEKMSTPADTTLRDSIDQAFGIGKSFEGAAKESASVLQNAPELPVTPSSMEAVSSAVQNMGNSFANAGKKTTVLTDDMKDLDQELKQKKTDTEETTSAFQNLRDGISNLFRPLTNLIGQFARVAKMRMMRAIIRQITAAFKEGVENYYHYSEAVKNGFSDAMDRAATSLQTMKNSIGAAVAPLIQALIPYLQQVVQWFVTLINYVNQFFSLLSGKSTWSQAVDTTAKAFEKKSKSTAKTVKDTADAVKDLLADFDELNIIQSAKDNSDSGNGGAGGSGSNTDYKKMFQEVPFSDGIKTLVDNLQEKFGSIKTLVTEIGALILAWKVGTAFAGTLSTLAGLVASGIIIDLVFKLSDAFTKTYLETGDDKYLFASLLTPVVGSLLAHKIAKLLVGRGFANLMVPIIFSVAAAATVKAILEDTDVSALDERTLKAAMIAAIEGAVAVGSFAKLVMGTSTLDAIIYGAAGAFITFGIAIGLKAIKDVFDTGEITEETIKADIISALSIGLGASIIAAKAGSGLAGVIATGAGAALLTFGVLIGLQATAEAMANGKITAETIKKDAMSGAFIGAGLLLITAKTGAGAEIAGTLASAAGTALISFGVLLGLQATAEVLANGKITEETIKNDAISAAFVGAGLGLLAAKAGAGIIGSLTAAAGGALITFGVLIGLQATAEVIANGKITEDTIKKDAISAAFVGAGLGLLAAKAGSGLAGSLATAAGGALITFGVLIGLQATAEVIANGKITEDTIKNDAISSAFVGAGIGLLAAKAGSGIVGSLTAAAGGALITFGVLIGLQATVEVAVNGKITEDTIKNDAISSAFVGSGVGLLAAKAGSGLVGSLAAAAGGALITFGVLIGLQATAEVANTGLFTEETIKNDLISSLTVGTGIGFIAAKEGAGIAGTLTSAAGGAFITLGVLVGLQAAAQVLATGKITESTLKDAALGSAFVGAGVGFIAAKQGAGIVGTLTSAAGGALIAFGVFVGLQATAEVIASGKITADTIKEDAISSAFVGTGVGFVAAKAGLGIVGTLSAAAGGALIAFGVLVGLQTVVEVAKGGEITKDTLTKAGISSALVGAGLAIVSIAVGATSVSALALAGGAAIVTFAALVGVQAILTADKEEPVKWGETKLTEEEITAFVGDMFVVKPSVTIDLLNSKITATKEQKEKLTTKVGDTLGTLAALRLGLDPTQSLEQLKEDVFNKETGLIAEFNKYAELQVTQVKTTLSLVPVPEKKEGKENEVKTAAEEIDQGWTDLQDEMGRIGNALTAELKAEYDESLDSAISEERAKTIEKLTNMMTDISNAVTYGQATAASLAGFEKLASGVTRETASNIIHEYGEVKRQLLAAAEGALTETAQSALALANAYDYLARKAETAEERAEYEGKASHFRQIYQERIEAVDEEAKSIVKSQLANSETTQELTNMLLGALDPNYLKNAVTSHKFQGADDIWTTLYQELLEGGDTSSDEFKENFAGKLETFLIRVLDPKDAQVFIDAIDEGALDYAQLFGPEFFSAVAEAMDLGAESEEVRNRFTQMITDIFGEDFMSKVVLPEVVKEYQHGSVGDSHQKYRSRAKAMAKAAAETTYSSVQEAFEKEDWQHMADDEFDTFLTELKDKFGSEELTSVLENLNIPAADIRIPLDVSFEENPDGDVTGRTPWHAGHLQGRAGYRSGVYYTGGEEAPSEATVSGEKETVQAGVQDGTSGLLTEIQTGRTTRQGDVQTGVKNGTADINSVLQSILEVARLINQKEFSVNLVPTAGFGRFVGMSNDEYGRVTGDR